jgi:hypothetical protein
MERSITTEQDHSQVKNFLAHRRSELALFGATAALALTGVLAEQPLAEASAQDQQPGSAQAANSTGEQMALAAKKHKKHAIVKPQVSLTGQLTNAFYNAPSTYSLEVVSSKSYKDVIVAVQAAGSSGYNEGKTINLAANKPWTENFTLDFTSQVEGNASYPISSNLPEDVTVFLEQMTTYQRLYLETFKIT